MTGARGTVLALAAVLGGACFGSDRARTARSGTAATHEPESEPPVQPAPKDVPMPASKLEEHVPAASDPFTLSFTVGPELQLTASLFNLSSVEQRYLHNKRLQPSRLVLIDGSGREHQPVDRRSVMKFNATPDAASFQTVGPGASVLLEKTAPRRDSNGTYSVDWGPFRFRGLAPGVYRGRVEWVSESDTYNDSETGRKGKIAGLWKGRLVSDEAAVHFP